MAGKITELAVQPAASAADADLIELVDVSDTSMAASGTNKSMTFVDLKTAIGGVTDGDKGDITVSASGATWTIDTDAINAAKIAANAVDTAEINNAAVTNAKLANVVTNSIKGRVAASTGVPTDLTPAQARTVIASDSGGGTTNFLAANGTWATPAAGGVTDGDKGDITVSGSGATWTIDNGAVTAAKVAADVATQAELDAVAAAKANLTRTINSYSGTSVTAVLGDAGAYVRLTGTNPTYTVPLNSAVAFPIGTQIDGTSSATTCTIAATGGVTITKPRTLVTAAAGSGWTLIKHNTDAWDLHGDFV